MFNFLSAILILSFPLSLTKSIDTTTVITLDDNEVNNNIIDFDEDITVKFHKKYGMVPWHANEFDKKSLRYTIVRDANKNNDSVEGILDNNEDKNKRQTKDNDDLTTEDFRVIPLELISTTEDPIISLIESTTEQDLTVIPLSTTEKIQVTIEETITLPTTASYANEFDVTTENNEENRTSEGTTEEVKTTTDKGLNETTFEPTLNVTNELDKIDVAVNITQKVNNTIKFNTTKLQNETSELGQIKLENHNTTRSSGTDFESSREDDVPIFTELDTEVIEDIPEDYYDSKDVVPTSAPKTDAISVLFGLAGSVVESVVETVAERVVPKSIYDLFKRMQKQNEALEAERLRSREENGGLGMYCILLYVYRFNTHYHG